MPELPSISHVALAVTDLATSARWYERLFGVAPATTSTERTVFVLAGGQLLGLTAHDTARSHDRSDVAAPGLDRVGFACADRPALAAWQTHLDQIGVAHGGVVEATDGWTLAFSDPDGNALEFSAPAS